ncbi:hypothetical protein SDC9_128117 [bioreactor metagenome]|uniref:N-acetyltransferase domain-containing protein n=1 Tax=bioreactor metagenome TaxID=1076179 RepID=A0A645CW21_9ZZZZ
MTKMKKQLFYDLKDYSVLMPPSVLIRSINAPSAAAIGEALLDSYRDEIDYEGETLQQAIEEIQAVRGGCYGPIIQELSGCVLISEQVAAALFVTASPSGCFIPYIFTRKTYRRQGLAKSLLSHCLIQAAASGYPQISLYVTVGHDSAHKLYYSLGFHD